jgi:hypothetical protein
MGQSHSRKSLSSTSLRGHLRVGRARSNSRASSHPEFFVFSRFSPSSLRAGLRPVALPVALLALTALSACTADRIGGTASYLFLDPDHRVWCQTYDRAHPDVTYDDWPSYNCDLNAALKAQLPVVTLHLPEPQSVAAWSNATRLSDALPSFDTWASQMIARGGQTFVCEDAQTTRYADQPSEPTGLIESYDAIAGYDMILVSDADTPETITRLRFVRNDSALPATAEVCK